MGRVLEWILKAWSVVLVLSAVLWIAPASWLPDRVYHFLVWGFGPTDGAFTGIRMGADFTDDTLAGIHASLPEDLLLRADQANTLDVQNKGDVNLGWSIQFFPEGLQGALHVALHVIPLLVMAVLWWWLATVVAQSRREEVFTSANARRLTIAGAVVGVGAPLLALANWLLHRWVLETSQFAERADIPAFGLAAVPWSSVAAGLALTVLGAVWRKGARKEHELAGLV